MKLRTLAQGLVPLALLTLVRVLWLEGNYSPSIASVIQRSASPAVTPAVTPAPAPRATEGPLVNPWKTRPPSQTAPRADEERVAADQVLATVNQTPLRLRELMPLRAGETGTELTPAQYDSRLQRAIEIELTFQAARTQGVELTVAQQQRVGQIAASGLLAPDGYERAGLTWTSATEEQVEFEKRLLTAQMLEQNLLAKKAAVSPSPDPATQTRYEQARRQMFDQLQADASITRTVPEQK